MQNKSETTFVHATGSFRGIAHAVREPHIRTNPQTSVSIVRSSGTLQVTDLFVIGDEFEVYKNGFSMGLTSPSAYDAGVYTLDADAAWGDARFSKGSFGVSATDIITIRATAYPPGYNDVTVALRLVTVPEPGSVFLLAAGLLALGVVARRRRA